MNNFPRIPVRFLEGNNELLKSQEVLSGGHAGSGTDNAMTESAPVQPATVVSSFRAPADRNIGNVLFRRMPDGSLDYDNAKNVVIDVIHKVKDKGDLTELEKITLSVMFPGVFNFADPSMRESMMKVHLRLDVFEVMTVCEMVAAHLSAEMNYNAGLGGGSTPGREVTRS